MEEADSELKFKFVDFEAPPPKFLCAITGKFLFNANPQVTMCCGEYISLEAARMIKNNDKACPKCRKEILKYREAVRLDKKELPELKIYCTNKKNGCDVIVNLVNLENHLSANSREGDCKFIRVTCPLLCSEGKNFFRKDIPHHVRNDCPHRYVKCAYCRAIHKEIDRNDHLKVCPERPLPCPNKCCDEKKIKRRLLDEHVNEDCPNQEVSCDYLHAGCDEKFLRKDRSTHNKQLMSEHLELVNQLSLQQKSTIVDLMEHKAKTDAYMAKTDAYMYHLTMLTHSFLMPQNKHSTSLRPVSEPPPIFKLNNFKERRKNKNNVWRSEPFNSHICGYSMCLEVNVSGRDAGKGTHVSVYVRMVSGVCDDMLQWPFKPELITVHIIGRDGERPFTNDIVNQDIHDSKPIGYAKTFERVIGQQVGENAWGIAEFISHEELSQKYLINDSILFRVSCIRIGC